jgi:hypothetical protein
LVIGLIDGGLVYLVELSAKMLWLRIRKIYGIFYKRIL